MRLDRLRGSWFEGPDLPRRGRPNCATRRCTIALEPGPAGIETAWPGSVLRFRTREQTGQDGDHLLMKFELGAYSFGAAGKSPEGEMVSTAQAVRNLLEQIRVAEQAGLDFFGVGEHHTASMPVSSPAAVINAAAAVTTTITLSTAVSVLSTDDPIRLYQQMATAAIVSGGRAEIIAGRGSSTDSFPLFGYDLDDYDRLYADKLGLLLAVNDSPLVSWESPFRPPLKDALVVPRPDKPIPILLRPGGDPLPPFL